MPVTDAAARRFVAGRYGSRVTEVEALGAGEWSLAYAMTLDGRPVVTRLGDHVADFRKDQVMAAYTRAVPVQADQPSLNRWQ
jgi:hygromycin-B 4-O-kinase